jgi:NADPH-dependent 2,4-dienoyl-CoA reductase/sulfur reductase-like enzyme
MASKVEKIIPQEGNPTLAGGVMVNGTIIPADFVVMGVGVTPATAFLKGSGIKLESDGGIKVDQYLRVQSGPDTNDVYAIGIFTIFLCLHPEIDNAARRRYRGLPSNRWGTR